MAKAKSDAVWTEIDPTTLPEDVKVKYDAYKALYAKTKEARLDFETMLEHKADIPSGKRLVFGYNFGKLSVAVVDDDRKAKAAPQAKLGLSQFLAMQRESGRRV